MSLSRSLEPEWLDALPAFDTGAIGSRADLARLNRLMFQAEILHRILTKHCAEKNPLSILELGAGDGTFMLRLARKLRTKSPDVSVTLLDRASLVTQKTLDGFAACGWKATPIEADALAYLEAQAAARVDVVTANLFLHHLPEVGLARLFRRAAQLARLFVACEPRRNRFALFSSRMLWAVGCNNVTLHDAPASVHAGFSGGELSALWPQKNGWRLSEYAAGPFTHCFVARHADRE
jgi:Methyltransferase domain